MTTLSIQISDDAAIRLDRLAQKIELSRSILAERAIEYFVDTEEWQLSEIEVGLDEARRGNFASDEETANLFRGFLE